MKQLLNEEVIIGSVKIFLSVVQRESKSQVPFEALNGSGEFRSCELAEFIHRGESTMSEKLYSACHASAQRFFDDLVNILFFQLSTLRQFIAQDLLGGH